MRNTKRLLVKVGASAVLVVAMAAVSATQAGAAVWTPPNTTGSGNASGLTTLSVVLPTSSIIRCSSSTMTMQSSPSGSFTWTKPVTGGGVTFSGCSHVTFGVPATAAMTSFWEVHANSTSSTTIKVPANSFTITVGNVGHPSRCTIHLAAVNIPTGWAANKLGPNSAINVPYTVTGPAGFCGGNGGQLSLVMGGWTFPTFSII